MCACRKKNIIERNGVYATCLAKKDSKHFNRDISVFWWFLWLYDNGISQRWNGNGIKWSAYSERSEIECRSLK